MQHTANKNHHLFSIQQCTHTKPPCSILFCSTLVVYELSFFVCCSVWSFFFDAPIIHLAFSPLHINSGISHCNPHQTLSTNTHLKPLPSRFTVTAIEHGILGNCQSGAKNYSNIAAQSITGSFRPGRRISVGPVVCSTIEIPAVSHLAGHK